MSDPVMLTCGCAANAVRVQKDGTRIPSCVIHDCVEVAPIAPELSSRTARCAYYGARCKPMGTRGGCECDVCRKTLRCSCERPSSSDLAFFKHQPDKPHDSFYCGCSGWD